MTLINFGIKIKYDSQKRSKEDIKEVLEDFLDLLPKHIYGIYGIEVRGVI